MQIGAGAVDGRGNYLTSVADLMWICQQVPLAPSKVRNQQISSEFSHIADTNLPIFPGKNMMQSRRIFGTLILFAGLATTALTPAMAQTAGTWSGDATRVTLTAADGSAVLNFQCDATAAELFVTSSTGGSPVPTRITVRANNGTAYSVPLTVSAEDGEMRGEISTSLVNQQGFAEATTIVVTAPPSNRPAIIVDVVPALSALISGCPAG